MTILLIISLCIGAFLTGLVLGFAVGYLDRKQDKEPPLKIENHNETVYLIPRQNGYERIRTFNN